MFCCGVLYVYLREMEGKVNFLTVLKNIFTFVFIIRNVYLSFNR